MERGRHNAPNDRVFIGHCDGLKRVVGGLQPASAILFPKAAKLDGQLPGAFWRQKRAGRNAVLAKGAGLRAPGTVHKFLKKLMNWQGEFKEYIDIQRKISSASRILVIDDVLTTGLTMGTLFHQLKTLGAHRIEGLVLAAADQG